MKIFNKYFVGALLLGSTLGLTSCDLDEYNPSSESSENVFATEQGIEGLVNQMYYNSDEMYQIEHVDILVEDIGFRMMWNDTPIVFVKTPGHTDKGMCVEIGGCLFTGDTVLFRTKPFLKKRYGASKEELKASIEHLYKTSPGETRVYPGHGEVFEIRETEDFYKQYFNEK